MQRNPVRILLIEDNRGDARLLEQLLRDAAGLRWELCWIDDLERGIATLQQGGFDLVMLDLHLPGSSGIETVLRLRGCGTALPALIVMSGLNDEDVAIQAVQAGAEDYLVKGQVDSRMLARAIRYALERSQSRAALRQAHDELEARVVERTAELRRREQEFRTLAENAPDMVIRYDTDCRRTYVNPAFVRETGMPAEEALYMEPDKMAQWQADMQMEDYKIILQQVMDSGRGTEVYVRNLKGRSNARDYAFHLVPERNTEGQVVGVLAIGRNITALKESERRLSESQQQLRQLALHSDAVREEERKYLTREIHDELGQYLSALRMGVSVLEMQFGSDNPALAERTRALTGLVDSTIQVVRNVVSRLRPGALSMGIVPALEWLIEQFMENDGAICQLHVDEARIELDEARAVELFRIVQESLTNVRRHAEASRVDVTLARDDERYLLEVRDNGLGFDPAQRKQQSFGLVGIRERALKLGGSVEITSAPGRGTRVCVQFPLRSALAPG
ncbi:MAG TPA: response regulator [Pseudoduganella sp.]